MWKIRVAVSCGLIAGEGLAGILNAIFFFGYKMSQWLKKIGPLIASFRFFSLRKTVLVCQGYGTIKKT